jgi:hypothetical protein
MLLLGACMIALSAALVYHASAMRYEVTHLNPLAIVRTDRLTGHSDLCVENRLEGKLVCGAAVRGDTLANQTSATPETLEQRAARIARERGIVVTKK